MLGKYPERICLDDVHQRHIFKPLHPQIPLATDDDVNTTMMKRFCRVLGNLTAGQ
jgi:hypothetical protein